MAKRAPTDRNQLAILKRKNQAASGVWESNNGRIIKLKKPDLMFIQTASSSVDIPPPPTYEVKVGNKTREYPLDELVIKQTEDEDEKKALQQKWDTYQAEYAEAMNTQSWRATGAIFYEGTQPDAEMVENDTKWHKRMKITGWAKTMPDDPEELWVFYLQTSLDETEIVRLGSAIVLYAGGASEEKIKAAEGMFFDDLPTDERSGDVEDAGSDEGGDRE